MAQIELSGREHFQLILIGIIKNLLILIIAGFIGWTLYIRLNAPQKVGLSTPTPTAIATKAIATATKAKATQPAANIPTEQGNFISFILGFSETSNQEVLKQRKQILNLYKDFTQNRRIGLRDRHLLENFTITYRQKNPEFTDAATWKELLRRVDIIPNSLVIAQAVNESAWGRSRFAKEGNNYFGIWCFTPNCGMVPAKRAPGAKHEVQSFSTPLDSVRFYMKSLNSHGAYSNFRAIREDLRKKGKMITGSALAPALLSYSERGEAYTKSLNDIITRYSLTQYDDVKKFSDSDLNA